MQCVLGTNPISFAAPAKKDPFVLDMATSTAAIGKVRDYSLAFCDTVCVCRWSCRPGKIYPSLVGGLWIKMARSEILNIAHFAFHNVFPCFLQETHDPHGVLDGGGLMPLGGLEATGETNHPSLYIYLLPDIIVLLLVYVILLLFCVCFSAGYKGYGLAMMVEVMCGMLGGGTYAHHIRKWSRDDQRPADLV